MSFLLLTETQIITFEALALLVSLFSYIVLSFRHLLAQLEQFIRRSRRVFLMYQTRYVCFFSPQFFHACLDIRSGNIGGSGQVTIGCGYKLANFF